MAEPTHNHTRWRNDDDPWSPCPPSCPAGPGEDVRAEAREQIAEALHVTGTRPGFAEQDAWTRWTTLTDAVLAVPAVAEALALRGRVKALIATAPVMWHGDYPVKAVPVSTLLDVVPSRRVLGEDGR